MSKIQEIYKFDLVKITLKSGMSYNAAPIDIVENDITNKDELVFMDKETQELLGATDEDIVSYEEISN